METASSGRSGLRARGGWDKRVSLFCKRSFGAKKKPIIDGVYFSVLSQKGLGDPRDLPRRAGCRDFSTSAKKMCRA